MPEVVTVQDNLTEMSVMQSEATSMLHHWEEKKSWTNQALTSVQRGSLQVIREQADAMNVGAKYMLNVFVANMKVRVYRAF